MHFEGVSFPEVQSFVEAGRTDVQIRCRESDPSIRNRRF